MLGAWLILVSLGISGAYRDRTLYEQPFKTIAANYAHFMGSHGDRRSWLRTRLQALSRRRPRIGTGKRPIPITFPVYSLPMMRSFSRHGTVIVLSRGMHLALQTDPRLSICSAPRQKIAFPH